MKLLWSYEVSGNWPKGTLLSKDSIYCPPTCTNCLLLGSDLVVVGGQMAEDQDETRTGDHETASVINEAEAVASSMSSKDDATNKRMI
ncbi:hypothetical protein ACH5RR_003289 [Cinchona calisaya]|uniref:Uncharacterized protein n=1 Tax=Cinchona calisaya TaxID=153742 RepID=A0ABD3AUS1_9GENT